MPKSHELAQIQVLRTNRQLIFNGTSYLIEEIARKSSSYLLSVSKRLHWLDGN